MKNQERIMKKLNILKLAAMLVAAAFMSVSCNDWLDVKPRAQEEADRLFQTEDGFKEVLAGCYTGLSQPSLYGRQMTYGVASVLGQEWSSGASFATTSGLYYLLQRYNYTHDNVVGTIDKIWSDMYNVIAEVNTLLEYTEKKRGVLNDLYYGIIRGEALALRAYAHADLFRLYGDVIGMSPDDGKVALPYIRTSEAKVTAQSTNKIFYELIMKDLDEALKLLEVDPIYTGADLSGDDHGYLANRQFHLNYYAVLGLKARMCMYYGDKTGAMQAATTVIEAQRTKGVFPWVTKDQANNTNLNLRDRTFSSEHLFGFNIMKLEENIKGYFTETTDPLTSRITPKGTETALYSAADYRGVYFETYSGIANVFSKFWQMPNTSTVLAVRNKMPAIRISEMYYIAAECSLPNRAVAMDYLNEVIVHRNLDAIPVPEFDAEVEAEILKEYQREFLGEGQLFFYHKRMNTKFIATANADYILPLPATELELGNRQPIKNEE